MWPVNGPWTFLQLPRRCGWRKQGASCYIQLTPLPLLLQLCSKRWAGLPYPDVTNGPWHFSTSPRKLLCLATVLALFASDVGVMPENDHQMVGFIVSFSSSDSLFILLHLAQFQKTEFHQPHQSLASADGGYQQGIRRLGTVIRILSP